MAHTRHALVVSLSSTCADCKNIHEKNVHEGGRGKGVEAPPIERISRDRELPLSFAQQRLWFIQQLEPDRVAYNMPIEVSLRGDLNVAALAQSISEILRRHEVLRTRFVSQNGRPRQEIVEPTAVEVSFWDLSGLRDAGEAEKYGRKLVDQEGRRPFNLELGPAVRTALVRLGPNEHILFVCLHHVVSDGWSTRVLVREFGALYDSSRQGRVSGLKELPVQYADFAVWQREWLKGDVMEVELGYWRSQLAGITALDMPVDRPRRGDSRHLGANLGFRLAAELTAGLKEVSRREGASLFMTVLTAFQMVLSRYTGQEDIVVGTEVANRNRLETEREAAP